MEDILHGRISKQELGTWLDEMKAEKKFRAFIKGEIGLDRLFRGENNGKKRDKDLA